MLQGNKKVVIDACYNAKVAVGIAAAATLIACASGNPWACGLAAAAGVEAVRLMKEACGGTNYREDIGIDIGVEAKNRKFSNIRKNKFQFQT